MENQISQRIFGYMPDGQSVTEYTLVNKQGVELRAIDYGCTITALKVPDRDGVKGDIVLGFESLDEYLDSKDYMGCIIGRCAGRIQHGRLQIEGVNYPLTVNQPPHHLHGGIRGFSNR